MPENGRKFIEHSGLLKTIEINQSNYHSDRLKKAAGQVSVNFLIPLSLTLHLQGFTSDVEYRGITAILQERAQIEANKLSSEYNINISKASFHILADRFSQWRNTTP